MNVKPLPAGLLYFATWDDLDFQASESTHTREIGILWFSISTETTSVGTCPSIDNLSSLLSGWLAFAKLIVRS